SVYAPAVSLVSTTSPAAGEIAPSAAAVRRMPRWACIARMAASELSMLDGRTRAVSSAVKKVVVPCAISLVSIRLVLSRGRLGFEYLNPVGFCLELLHFQFGALYFQLLRLQRHFGLLDLAVALRLRQLLLGV